eukprot:4294061-Pleurochrysis_carterae.AAC.3
MHIIAPIDVASASLYLANKSISKERVERPDRCCQSERRVAHSLDCEANFVRLADRRRVQALYWKQRTKALLSEASHRWLGVEEQRRAKEVAAPLLKNAALSPRRVRERRDVLSAHDDARAERQRVLHQLEQRLARRAAAIERAERRLATGRVTSHELAHLLRRERAPRVVGGRVQDGSLHSTARLACV